MKNQQQVRLVFRAREGFNKNKAKNQLSAGKKEKRDERLASVWRQVEAINQNRLRKKTKKKTQSSKLRKRAEKRQQNQSNRRW